MTSRRTAVSRDILTDFFPAVVLLAVAEHYVAVPIGAHEASLYDPTVTDLHSQPLTEVALQKRSSFIGVHFQFPFA